MMLDSDTGETKEEMKRVYRHIEAIFESLRQIGVETIDPVGRVYDSGMALKVISFEPEPGLSNEEIKETIKPSVAWQGRLIQIGEVIVGTPQTI
jgi:molecular chaperone GrpE (heat shock protein)